MAEWLRRLTRNQIPYGSAGSNPAGCDNFFPNRNCFGVLDGQLLPFGQAGSLAEWSKALVLGTSPKGRGFESHSCQNPFAGHFKV